MDKNNQTVEAPTPELIEEWKSAFGRVFKKDICGRTYYFRPLYHQDWQGIVLFVRDNPDARGLEFDEEVVRRGLLFPQLSPVDWATLPAGVVPTLSMYIRDKSGFIVEGLSEPEPAGTVAISDEQEGDPPTAEEREALKGRYAAYSLKMVRLGGKYWVIRPITRLEWRQMQSEMVSEADVDITACQRCVVWSSGGEGGKSINWDLLPVGYAATLSAKILEISGFNTQVDAEEL